MTFKIHGLDNFQKELEGAERALKQLDGVIASITVDPNQSGSVLAAIGLVEAKIDQATAAYRSNPFVQQLVEGLKENYRSQIEEMCAVSRSENGEADEDENVDEIPTIFRQIENTVNDLKWADSSSFGRHIKKLSRLLHSQELEPFSNDLAADIDLAAWIKAGEATQTSMVGSAELAWPTSQREEIGTVILLIDRFADDPDYAWQFAHEFYYSGGKITQELQNLTAQVIVPFARDYIDFVKAQTGAVEATMLPKKSEPAARKVFIVHGHDEGAREGVARFLQSIGFEPIILHEQANQGRTIIEKIEAHGDVGFAVVLLTPDDVGSVKDGNPRPRARQNVLLELGYFLGRLGRSRVCAITRGDIELPSDFGGVVYEPYDNSGGWKRALGRELEAAGFEIDWNAIMRR